MFAFQIFLFRENIYMRIIFTDKNSILYTLEKSKILENTKCYENTEVAELFCVVYNIFVDASVPRRN